MSCSGLADLDAAAQTVRDIGPGIHVPSRKPDTQANPHVFPVWGFGFSFRALDFGFGVYISSLRFKV